MIGWSAHLSTLYAGLPTPLRPAAACADGAAAVETWWIEQEHHEAWLEALRQARLEVVVITAHAGDLAAGERGFLNLPSRHAEVSFDILAAIDLASRCGASFVNVAVGKDSHRATPERQLDRVRGVLAELSAPARAAGVGLLVEPQNPIDVPDYLLPNAAAAARLVERIGSGSVGLLYDAYHAAAAGGDPARELDELSGIYQHVQYADHPGRGPAGSGRLALGGIVEALRRSGYRGRIGLEYFPLPGESDPFAAIRTHGFDGVESLAPRAVAG